MVQSAFVFIPCCAPSILRLEEALLSLSRRISTPSEPWVMNSLYIATSSFPMNAFGPCHRTTRAHGFLVFVISKWDDLQICYNFTGKHCLERHSHRHPTIICIQKVFEPITTGLVSSRPFHASHSGHNTGARHPVWMFLD